MKTVTISEMYLAVAAVVLLAIAAGFALHLWGVEGMGPCEVDAPMERAQCAPLGLSRGRTPRPSAAVTRRADGGHCAAWMVTP